MKNSVKLFFVILLIIFTTGNFLKAQMNEACLCTSDAVQNFESRSAIDTCNLEPSLSARVCSDVWEMADLEFIFQQKRVYTKTGLSVYFNEDAIVLPAVPHDSIVDVGWEKIDTSLVELRELFKYIEDKYGKFILRKNDPEFSTGEFSWHYRIIFENYINLADFLKEFLEMPNPDFTFNLPAWPTTVRENVSDDIIIHPNPTSENITITLLQNQSFKTTKLTLRDLAGREMFLKEIDALQDSYTFSLKEIPTGVYILEVRFGNEIFTKQVSVIR